MDAQSAEFQSWGITGDWGNRYCTMGSFAVFRAGADVDREYEIKQLDVFLEMVKKGTQRLVRN